MARAGLGGGRRFLVLERLPLGRGSAGSADDDQNSLLWRPPVSALFAGMGLRNPGHVTAERNGWSLETG
jgi:hypothetical protein